jgi:hypothetical protein
MKRNRARRNDTITRALKTDGTGSVKTLAKSPENRIAMAPMFSRAGRSSAGNLTTDDFRPVGAVVAPTGRRFGVKVNDRDGACRVTLFNLV